VSAAVVTTRRLPTPRRLSEAAFLGVLIIFVGYLVGAPLWSLQAEALADGGQKYADVYSSASYWSVLVRTVGLTLGGLAISMTLGTWLAWQAVRLPKRLKFLVVVPMLPIVLPQVSAVVGWAFLMSPRPGYLNQALRQLPWWNDTTEGPLNVYALPSIIMIVGLSLTSFVYVFVLSGIRNINSEVIEAAMVSGSSYTGAFLKIAVPILRPVLLYAGGVALLLALGQFTAPLLLGRNQGVDVISTEIYTWIGNSPIDYGMAAALGSPLLVVGLLVILMWRYLLRDSARYVTHGGKGFTEFGRPSRTAAVSMTLFGLLSSGLPLLALIFVSLKPFWQSDFTLSGFSTSNYQEIFADARFVDGIRTSLVASLTAMVLAIALAYLCANLLVRSRRFRAGRWLLDFLVNLPLGVPTVVVGAGFLIAYTSPPFILYGTTTVLVLVYVTLMLPFATRMIMSGMMALGDSYYEASRVSGASALRTHLQIMLPLLRPAFAGSAALVFVLLTHEFTASLLVRSPFTQVMGTVLYEYWQLGQYPKVAAVAVVMTLVTGLGIVIALVIGGSMALKRRPFR
jgi:iron(III) transport system permease protein